VPLPYVNSRREPEPEPSERDTRGRGYGAIVTDTATGLTAITLKQLPAHDGWLIVHAQCGGGYHPIATRPTPWPPRRKAAFTQVGGTTPSRPP